MSVRKKVLLGALGCLLINTALFPMIYFATQYFWSNVELFRYMNWAAAGIHCVRLALAVLLGLFLRRKPPQTGRADAATWNKRMCFLGGALALWLIYKLSILFQVQVLLLMQRLFNPDIALVSYEKTPVLYQFLCEVLTPPQCLVIFVVCWSCILLGPRESNA